MNRQVEPESVGAFTALRCRVEGLNNRLAFEHKDVASDG